MVDLITLNTNEKNASVKRYVLYARDKEMKLKAYALYNRLK